MGLFKIANTILGDEHCWALFEIHEQSPNSKGFHRYQIIYVNRDGNLAEWRKDMGPSSKFKGVKQLRIPSLWEHTCDQLMNLADELRGEKGIDIRDLFQLEAYKPA